MDEAKLRKKMCCFTGHRPQKLNRPEEAIRSELKLAIKNAIAKGYRTFITGMAYGVDIWAGEIVVQFKKRYPSLRLIAAIPFPDFGVGCPHEWKKRYDELLAKADLVEVISPSYHPGVYQRRNEWLVGHSSFVIAVFNGEKSGTKNTIDYAQRCGVPIEVIEA